MKFDTPATTNPIDQLKVVGRPADRIDGPLKTTGTAPYAYDRHDVVANQVYGYVVGSAIAKGRIVSMDLAAAKAAPGVLAIVTSANAGKLAKGNRNTALLLGGPEIQHYHQAIALVVAESFEQARAAAQLVRVEYSRGARLLDLFGDDQRDGLVVVLNLLGRFGAVRCCDFPFASLPALGGSDDGEHAGRGFRGGEVHRYDAALSDGRADDIPIDLVRHHVVAVVGVGCGPRSLERAVDAVGGSADDLELVDGIGGGGGVEFHGLAFRFGEHRGERSAPPAAP